MEEDGDPNVPRSLMMAGGPIDTRVNPTVVNTLAVQRGTDWFRTNVITSVPWPNAGLGRQVYPGFLQLSGFMTMNLDRHMTAHKELFQHLVHGDGDSAEKHREFYDEYLAVMDLTAEFFLQTVDSVFVRHLLPRGQFTHRGRRVNLGAIRNVALLTIEGEKDDITGIGQCRAALDLCTGVPAEMKEHFECPKVGHYGVFNGSRFRRQIAPRIAAFARLRDQRTAHGIVTPPLDRSVDERRADASQASEPHNAAFTFQRDDERAHRAHMTSGRPNPGHVNGRSAGDGLGAAIGAGFTPLRFWQLAGSMFFQGLSQFHADPR